MLEERKIFLRDGRFGDEKYRPKFGYNDNVFRRSVELKEDLLKNNPDKLHGGVFLTQDSADGKWKLADEGEVPAHPMVDEQVQYDNTLDAYGGVTVLQGSVPHYTKHFEGTPSKGDGLKCVGGKLVVMEDTDPEEIRVGTVSAASGSIIEFITKY